jgi:hypothetical protein
VRRGDEAAPDALAEDEEGRRKPAACRLRRALRCVRPGLADRDEARAERSRGDRRFGEEERRGRAGRGARGAPRRGEGGGQRALQPRRDERRDKEGALERGERICFGREDDEEARLARGAAVVARSERRAPEAVTPAGQRRAALRERRALGRERRRRTHRERLE